MSSTRKSTKEESRDKDISMKSLFPGHYKPTQADFDALWSDGIVVLDTNVLLSLYRTPDLARNEIIGILEKIKEKIWIPYHVALEFQRNRPQVIEDSIKRTTETFEKSKSAIKTAINAINSLEIEKHSKNLSPKDILNALEKSLSLTEDVEAKLSTQQPGLSIEDELRASIDNLIESRIGHPPKNQNELDELVKDADKRYALMIPPGFKDTSKTDEEFCSNGIKYKRKHGDLIIWRQIINHCKENSVNNITIITNDKKDDWWWIEKGKTLGPHHELCHEIRSESNVKNFWMYKLENFVKLAGEKLGNSISEETIIEIKEANSNTNTDLEGDIATNKNYDIALEIHHNNIVQAMSRMKEKLALIEARRQLYENKNSHLKDKNKIELDKLYITLQQKQLKERLHDAEQKKIHIEELMSLSNPTSHFLLGEQDGENF